MMVSRVGITAATHLNFEPQLHLMGGAMGNGIVRSNRPIVGDDDRLLVAE